MSIFDVITLAGGLAMFLYGMRMMGDGLKACSGGALQRLMESLTSNPVKSFLLGLGVTAFIQSSTATIVITSGLVGAGILTLHQSLGIIIGANVGTTVTGQIIRLMDLNSTGTSFLQFFKPSTLAPLALIAGFIIIGRKFRNSDKIGQIIIGFGILFSGLMNMTSAVNVLAETGIFERVFTGLSENPFLAYLSGATVAFILQSSSATIGILQVFSMSGQLTFSAIYAVLVGVYLGDCVTTAIVCSIGARPEAKRVGIVNIMYNLAKTVAVFVGVTIAHKAGFLDAIWSKVIYSGGIANTNSIFNIVCAIGLFPLIGILEKSSYVIVKDKQDEKTTKQQEMINKLNPTLFRTPPIALHSVYENMCEMLKMAHKNIDLAFETLDRFDRKKIDEINADEEIMDIMTDKVSNYLVQLSARPTTKNENIILNYYLKVITELERLGDHATNIAEVAVTLYENDTSFSANAKHELAVVQELIDRVLDNTETAFFKRDEDAARHIEPLEEVVDDIVNALKDNHLIRLREGRCSVLAGTEFLNLMSDIERISDICSNVGVETVARINPDIDDHVHDYISELHAGSEESFNREYHTAHDRYFTLLKTDMEPANHTSAGETK